MTDFSRVAENRGKSGGSLEDLAACQMEMTWEIKNKQNAPNGMNFREMLTFMEDEDLRAHLIEIQYPHLVQEERMTPSDAEGYSNELEAARAMSRAVRSWRKEWGVTFILLSQMSRESRRDAVNGGTGGHGIGGSSLEQLVDYTEYRERSETMSRPKLNDEEKKEKRLTVRFRSNEMKGAFRTGRGLWFERFRVCSAERIAKTYYPRYGLEDDF
jgi:hypothetical protein